jgi:large subunit ribosomal protein L10
LRRIEKVAVIKELSEKLKKAEATILTDFKGLKVDALTCLRKQLREKDMEYKVIKNTLAKLALKDTPLEQIKGEIIGSRALAFCYTDPVALAQVLIDFRKKNEPFKIKKGILSGKVLDANEIEVLAQLPSREILLAQLLGAIEAAPAVFVGLLYNMLAQLLYILNAIKKSKE